MASITSVNDVRASEAFVTSSSRADARERQVGATHQRSDEPRLSRLDPSVMPQLPGSTPTQPLQDRVETVRFPSPVRYLVICGVLPPFFDAAIGQFVMFGHVKVLP
jgi:hypothetical protein